MKKRGFTLIELLVVIAIIAMLLAILMPALNKVKKIAMRVVCGTNLKGLGNAMTVYANDFAGQYPCQGAGVSHTWANYTTSWQERNNDFKISGKNLTVGASLYLLVRLADVSPKSFICPASDQVEFSGKNRDNLDIVELWDFGYHTASATTNAEGAAKCVSFSYHQPYSPNLGGAQTGTAGRFRADDTRSAAFAVMADRNPWYDPKITNTGSGWSAATYLQYVAGIGKYWETNWTPTQGTLRQSIMVANAQPHEREGQNVLYADGHNSFEKTSDVGVKNDNIYTKMRPETLTTTNAPADYWRVGLGPTPDRTGIDETPTSAEDSLLVNDFYPDTIR